MLRVVTMIGAVLAAGAVFAAEMRPLPWSAELNKPERYRANSSGEMKISRDAESDALRFDMKFKPGTDFWCYPVFTFQAPFECFPDAEEMRFDVRVESNDPAKPVKLAYVMVEGNEMIAYPKPTGEWQEVRIDLKEKVKAPEQAGFFRIGINPTADEATLFLRNVQFLSSRKPSGKMDAAWAVIPAAPGTVFTEQEPLKFTLRDGFQVPCEYVVRDWQGKEVANGTWPDEGRGELNLDALPLGYYTLTLDSPAMDFDGVRGFGIVVDPGARKRNPESFFAMDTAQSWLGRAGAENTRHPYNGFETISELCRRAGLEIVRERLSWSECEPQPGEFTWKQYMENADLLSERGVKVSGMYHNCPNWARSHSEKLPDDLVATYRFAARAAKDFEGKMADWEFWNEQDIGFSLEPAWDFAANLKAAYLGFKSTVPELPVLMGGIAVSPLKNYNDVVMENDTIEFFDIFNVHTYRQLCEYPEFAAGIHAFMKKHGMEHTPLWLTECGPVVEGSARGTSYMKGLRAHSPEQEMLIAEFAPKSQITMQSLGFDRDFYFVLSPYNEQDGAKDWGLMRRDFSAKPGYFAFANLTNQLGAATYLGTYDTVPGVRGYLYAQPDGSRTLVFWSESEVDTSGVIPNLKPDNLFVREVSIPSDTDAVLTDNFGASRPVAAENGAIKLTATRYPAYLSGLRELEPSTPFVKRELRPAADSGRDKTVIFKTVLGDAFLLSAGKDFVELKTVPAPMTVEVFNLSNEPKTGTIEVAGAKLEGLPETVTVPAFGKVSLPVKLDPQLNDGEFETKMVLSGKFNGRETTRLVMPILQFSNMLKTTRQQPWHEAGDPGRWMTNSAGKQNISYDEAEKAVVFRTEFPRGVDRWTYPVLQLQLPQESLAGAYGVAFNYKVADPALIKQSLLMAVTGDDKERGKATYIQFTVPDGEWNEIVVPFPPEIDPDDIRMLRLGHNVETKGGDIFEAKMRNFRVLYMDRK